jgi:hypothetical protein
MLETVRSWQCRERRECTRKSRARQQVVRASGVQQTKNTARAFQDRHNSCKRAAFGMFDMYVEAKKHLDLGQAVDAHKAVALGGLNEGAVIVVLCEPHLQASSRLVRQESALARQVHRGVHSHQIPAPHTGLSRILTSQSCCPIFTRTPRSACQSLTTPDGAASCYAIIIL